MKEYDWEEEEDISDDVSTDENNIVAPHWSPVFTMDTESDILLLSVEADKEYSHIIWIFPTQQDDIKL